MNDKPTPPEGYEVMLGKHVPTVMPMGTQYWGENRWYEARSPIFPDRVDDWYAVPYKNYDLISSAPVQKPAPLVSAATSCPLCGKPECRCWDVPTPVATTALDTQVGGDHYKSMAIQPIEFCTRNGIGYAEGLAIKYIARHEKKNGAEDLDKAIHCLQILRELKYGKP